MNSRRKGAAGELEAAHAWTRATGLEARRGQQFSGSPDSPDLVVAGSRFHPEVKRLGRIAVLKALRQAERDAGPDRLPFALVREDGDTSWAVVVRLERLAELARELVDMREASRCT